MSHTDDINENATEESMLLLDLLYGELEGEAEAAAQTRVDSDKDLAGELEELRGLRGLFAAMPDEEPPAAVSAQLLHAAAAAAPTTKKAPEQEGGFFAWFRNLFGPIMRYPGLAAAASLFLVAGIAGVLYVSGSGKTAQPNVASRGDSPTATTESAPTGSAGLMGKDSDSTGEDKKAEPAYTDDLGNKSASPDPAPEGEETAARATKSKPPLEARKRRGKKGAVTRRPSFSSNQKSPPPPPGAKPADRGPSVRGKSGGRIVVNPKTVPPAKKPRPVADEADKTKGDVATNKPSSPQPPPSPAPTDSKKDSKKKAAEKVSQVLTLHRQARLAAKKGDCAKVRSITLKVRKLDSRYYDTKYLSDSSLRACLRSKPAVKK